MANAGRRITILGMGKSANQRKHDILRYCHGTEIWGFNNGYLFYGPELRGQWSRFFELHAYNYLKTWNSGAECHFSELARLDCPIYTLEPLPLIRKQAVVNLTEVVMHFDCNYFLGSPSLALMIALFEHDKGNRVAQINSYGIDTMDPQHAQQRASWAFWLSQAHARGIKYGGTSSDFFAEYEKDDGLRGLREKIGGEACAIKEQRSEAPVIIGGLLHCGTSMLAECLTDAGVQMASYHGTNVNHECNELMAIVKNELIRQGIDMSRIDDILAHETVMPEASEMFVRDLTDYKMMRDRTVPWGFKHPSVSLFPDAFKQVFPNAKLVICDRDDHDQAMSRLRRGFVRTEEDGIAAHRRRREHVLSIWDPTFVYNYNGDQTEQGKKMSEALGVKVDIAARYREKE